MLAKLAPSERVTKRGRAKAHVGRNARRNVGKGKGKGKSIDIVSSDDAAEPAPAPEPPPVAVQFASPAPGPDAVAPPVPPQAVGRRRLHIAELSFDRCPRIQAQITFVDQCLVGVVGSMAAQVAGCVQGAELRRTRLPA